MTALLLFQLRRVGRNRQYLFFTVLLPALFTIFFTKVIGGQLQGAEYQDVAGMFRSFHYAIYATLFNNKDKFPFEQEELFAAGEILTREQTPAIWAGIQADLGLTLVALGQRASGTGQLEEAVTSLQAALEAAGADGTPGVRSRALAKG